MRTTIGGVTLSAAAFAGILAYEGYRERAYVPIKGDVPTIGHGTTVYPDGSPVRMGDVTTPKAALAYARMDVSKFEGAVKKCVRVPLYPHEYDAFVSLAYNIGSGAFCGSTLVRRVNGGDYDGACREILRWDRARGRVVRGLAIRRRAEYHTCLGIRQKG